MKRFIFLFAIALACVSCTAKIKQYKVQVVKEYTHDTKAYTQGLFFENGQMYESTGQYGETTFRIVDHETGKVLRRLDFDEKYFGEGSVMLDGKMYMLTWLNKEVFVYDAETLEYLQTWSYPTEGWGITTDGHELITSDGSSKLYFLTPDFELLRTVNVTLDGRSMRYLNELEWIDGKIWANVYTTDTILIINPKSGEVEATIDCTNLLPRELRTSETDVLNGIAYNPDTKQIFLTGKYWPRLYEIRLVEKK